MNGSVRTAEVVARDRVESAGQARSRAPSAPSTRHRRTIATAVAS